MVTAARRGPVHRLAWLAIGTAVLSGVLALYGALHAEKHLAGTPLRAARGQVVDERFSDGLLRTAERSETVKTYVEWVTAARNLDDRILRATQRSKINNYCVQIVAFLLPFVLGIGAALLGAQAMAAVERDGGKTAGHTLSVFAMLIGGLGAVTSGCMMVSLYVWPRLPSLYTT